VKLTAPRVGNPQRGAFMTTMDQSQFQTCIDFGRVSYRVLRGPLFCK
jgi:hypothetical protein